MRRIFGICTRLSPTTALSLAVCAPMGLASAQAQGKTATDARMDKTAMKDRERMSSMMREEDEEDLLPAPTAYPWAAPGTLDLNHWTDLTEKHMKPGSATETQREKMQKKDEKKRMR